MRSRVSGSQMYSSSREGLEVPPMEKVSWILEAIHQWRLSMPLLSRGWAGFRKWTLTGLFWPLESQKKQSLVNYIDISKLLPRIYDLIRPMASLSQIKSSTLLKKSTEKTFCVFLRNDNQHKEAFNHFEECETVWKAVDILSLVTQNKNIRKKIWVVCFRTERVRDNRMIVTYYDLYRIISTFEAVLQCLTENS